MVSGLNPTNATALLRGRYLLEDILPKDLDMVEIAKLRYSYLRNGLVFKLQNSYIG